MKTHTFRTLALPGFLLISLATGTPAPGQSTAIKTPPIKTPPIKTPPIKTPPIKTRPINTPPINTPPINIRPINTPPINTPPINTPPINTPPINTPPINTPPIYTPARPGIISPPGYYYPPGTVVMPGYPAYPSAWIGPTIIRESWSEPAPAYNPPPQAPQGQNVPPNQAVITHRLVAILGKLQCHDVTNGGFVEAGGDQVCIAVGALAGYMNLPNPGAPGLTRASSWRAVGDFFGHYWDGPDWNATEGWNQPPMLVHPVFTLNEITPSTQPFEIGDGNKGIEYLRVAVNVFEYDTPPAAGGPGTASAPLALPRGRVPAMSDALNRINWKERSAPLGAPGAGLSATDLQQGKDVSFFGKALATFAERTMTGATTFAIENDRIGLVEWLIPRDQLSAIMRECPTFAAVSPTVADLKAQRDAARPPVSWIKPFDLRGANSKYTGEIWFAIVPDAALGAWLDANRAPNPAGAGGR